MDSETAEIAAIPDRKRRRRVALLLPVESAMVTLTEAVVRRGIDIARLGFKPADATHVAASEAGSADVLLSCDVRFCRVAQRSGNALRVRVSNPVDWLREIGYGKDT